MDLAESGMRYTQMPHVMEVGYANFFFWFLIFPWIQSKHAFSWPLTWK